MAIDPTVNLGLKKQDLGDEDWDAPLNATLDKLDKFLANTPLMNAGVVASVGSGACTFGVKMADGVTIPTAESPSIYSFRHTQIDVGGQVLGKVSSSIAVTLSSGSKLGFTDGQTEFVYIYALINAGVIELAVSGSDTHDQTVLQSTTAEGGAGGADDGNTLYSTFARTDVPIRLIARMTFTLATAGDWDEVADACVMAPFPASFLSLEGIGAGVANAVPHLNAAGNAILHSNLFVFTGLNLNIGFATPKSITGTASMLSISSDVTSPRGISQVHYEPDAEGAFMAVGSSRGVLGLMLDPEDGDALGDFSFVGAQLLPNNRLETGAFMRGRAAENWVENKRGTEIAWFTTKNQGTVTDEKMLLHHDGTFTHFGQSTKNRTTFSMTGLLPQFVINTDMVAPSVTTNLGLARYSTDGTGPILILGSSNNAVIGGYTLSADNDILGQILFAGVGRPGENRFEAGGSLIFEADQGWLDNSAYGTRCILRTANIGAKALTDRILCDGLANIVLGTGTVATNATSGFFYMVGCDGAPTGSATVFTGRNACIFDRTNETLNINTGGTTWVSVALT